MQVDKVISLKNGMNYMLLDKAIYNNTNYYLATKLDEDDEPTEESSILKEIVENGITYVVIEDNKQDIVQELMKQFVQSFNQKVSELPE